MQQKLLGLLSAILRHRAVKAALGKALYSAFGAGLKGWLAEYIGEDLWDALGKPVILTAIRKRRRVLDERDGKEYTIILRRADNAGNEDEYQDTLDDVFSSATRW